MGDTAREEITILLNQLKKGANTQEELLKFLYTELRRLAGMVLAKEQADHTFQATELVNEVYLKLFDANKLDWNDRKHFLSTAVIAMRRILVDHARKKIANKRIPKHSQQSLDDVLHLAQDEDTDIIKLDEALNVLAKLDPRQAKIVELRYFAGLTETEIAELFGLNRRTITRDWQTAKRWLKQEMYS